MPPPSAFMDVLGLPGDADERAVRKAYAQHLKQIDQAREPERFQQLRQAYEAALAWVLSKATAAETETAETQPIQQAPRDEGAASQTPASQAAGPVPEAMPGAWFDDETLRLGAEAVFTAFLDNLPLLPRPLWDTQWARVALSRALEDPRLVNLQARTVFESCVALHLVRGWRPGHEDLFTAAVEIFEWEQDRYRLAQFAQAGRILDEAIAERAALSSWDPVWREQVRELIQVLRHGEARPSPAFLADKLDSLRRLAASLPHWLQIVAPVDVIARWEHPEPMTAEAPMQNPTAPPAPPLPPSMPSSGPMPRHLVAFVCLFLWLCLNLVRSWVSAPPTASPPVYVVPSPGATASAAAAAVALAALPAATPEIEAQARHTYMFSVETRAKAVVCAAHISGFQSQFERSFVVWGVANEALLARGRALVEADSQKVSDGIHDTADGNAAMLEKLPAAQRLGKCQELLVTLMQPR